MADENSPPKEQKPSAASDALAKQGMLSGDALSRSLAEQFGMELYSDLTGYSLPKELLEKVPYAFVKKNLTLPLALEDELLIVAVADPLNLEPLQELKLMLDFPVKAVYSPKEKILAAINLLYNQEAGGASALIADMKEKAEENRREGDLEVYDLLDKGKGLPTIVRLLNLILMEAIQQGASDIHFDPTEEGLKVRYRIDGVLQLRHSPAPEYQQQLLARIKVMAKLDIAEHRLPQDGRIKLKMGPREIDFRVSTVPVVLGERIVLRILDKGNVIIGLETLGMLPRVYSTFKKLIAMPEGIILVTGPTGSGKTTTLYSAISEICNDEINIMTIEDPVEYNLAGIAQIGVRPKIDLTFAAGLRHILRQDPDVIMIGEIRDTETAEIAIQAALTGHLVLSTLHTNDAPSAITRLVDMGIEPYLLSSTIVGVMAQRLVRKICPDCKESYEPTVQERESVSLPESQGAFYRGRGCDNCFQTGYKGRHGLYEMMPITHTLQKQIVTSPDAIELRNQAYKSGIVTLRDHGAELIKEGVTTVAEVLRVTKGVE